MTTTFLAPDPVQSTFFIPGTNTPGNGVLLFTYLAGTSTKVTTYKDNAAGTSWTNPIVLDSGGNLSTSGTVWIAQGVRVKFVWAPSNDTDPPISPYRTIDNVSGVNDLGSAAQSEWVAGSTGSFIGNKTFSVGGDQTSTYTVSRRVKATIAAGTAYGTVSSVVFSSGATNVGLWVDSGNLDSGLSAVYYAQLAADNLSVPRMLQRVMSTQVFTSNATYNPSPNLISALVEIVAGGGSGGGAFSSDAAVSTAAAGGGGGAGGYAKGLFTYAQLSSGVAIVIGDGGTCVVSSGGRSGSTTSFGSLMFANGGTGGILSASGVANTGFSTVALSAGPQPGGAVSTGGFVNLPGAPGGAGWDTSRPGNVISALPGYGGASYFAPGGIGAVILSPTVTSGAVGFYGSGGSGAATAGTGPAQAGATGGKGVCIVTEQF